METSLVGRLAPSPTGAQHVGNARTFLVAWLAARSKGGKVLLRIEDIDSPRVKPWAVEQAAEDLRWLGLDWDGEPILQTGRLLRHRSALEKLKSLDLVYPCTCSRGDVEAAASAPHAEHEGPVYPGTCAHRRPADAASLKPPVAWRFRVDPGRPPITFEDALAGRVTLDLRRIGGDFVVWKANDTPAYQLAVVVDDAESGVTQVVRGDDLISSTPRQLLIYAALGWQAPRFIHVPLVVGVDGRRLAKRHGDTRLSALRQAGVAAEALTGLLAWSCGWSEDIRPIAPRELLPRFNLAAIPRQPFVLEEPHLRTIGKR